MTWVVAANASRKIVPMTAAGVLTTRALAHLQIHEDNFGRSSLANAIGSIPHRKAPIMCPQETARPARAAGNSEAE